MGKNLSKFESDTPEDIRSKRISLITGVSEFEIQNERAYQENDIISYRNSVVEKEVSKRRESARELISNIPAPESKSLPSVSNYIPAILGDSIFVGHVVTDLDSIAGAIGAAELYGGIAARASEVNSETQFALDYWGVATPLPIEKLVETQPRAGICLVDHQQQSQLHPCIDVERIVGVIDHHALQSGTIVTEKPIYMDIRPWGSMSTIIAHTFLCNQRRPRKCVAGMLLCAILSDTLNLQGPTTTDWDRMMVAILVEITECQNVEELCKAQFRAKSKELAGLSAMALAEGDMKAFNFKTLNFNGTVGFSVIETTDDAVLLDRKDEILLALEDVKKEKSLEVLYLAIVNIVALHSTLLMIGPVESKLAEEAFGGKLNDTDRRLMFIGDKVSRKKDFIPAVTRAIKAGFSMEGCV